MFKRDPLSLHPILVREVARALSGIFIENRHADKVIEYALKQNPKAGSRDRAFIAETTYLVVRYYRFFCAVLGEEPKSFAGFWRLIGIAMLVHPDVNARRDSLPDWEEFEDIKPDVVRAKAEKLLENRAMAESIPDWLDAVGTQELGDLWPATLHALNEPARVVLRTNTLKTTRADLQKRLLEEEVETEPVGEGDALVLVKRKNVFLTKAFKAGLFELQDYSSQQVAALLAPEPGMRVVDACAGGGGKALHLAALMQNKGNLIALDTVGWKLDALRLRARRAGASNIEARAIESRKVVKRLYGTADRLLLDVPCSGLGVLRRNPDSKWKLSEESIASLRQTQQEILQQYSPILKPGGRMLYATCSILPSENTEQVKAFLASEAGKNFRLLTERSILPQDEGFDGFFLALLEKQSEINI
ncbi:MAG: RNA methyltransferase [Saprospiraceae bacterium]|nr:RNA methyltransferase [Saprospiraceae bacterium]